LLDKSKLLYRESESQASYLVAGRLELWVWVTVLVLWILTVLSCVVVIGLDGCYPTWYRGGKLWVSLVVPLAVGDASFRR
jgi:hypothetical protein